jgi:hypothetical protein
MWMMSGICKPHGLVSSPAGDTCTGAAVAVDAVAAVAAFDLELIAACGCDDTAPAEVLIGNMRCGGVGTKLWTVLPWRHSSAHAWQLGAVGSCGDGAAAVATACLTVAGDVAIKCVLWGATMPNLADASELLLGDLFGCCNFS